MQNFKPGFAPIEAFVISVVLGIVGVTAFGQFQDLSAGQPRAAFGLDAKTSSAAAINYAAQILEPATSATAISQAAAGCGDAYAGTRSAAYPSTYGLTADAMDDAGITCH